LFTQLATARGVRFERIVSTGQSSPDGFWYDQEEDEFVLVLQGGACLHIAGDEGGPMQERRLGPGDWLLIPAHVRHRVAWTDPARPTVWLAVFNVPESPAEAPPAT
jgi:cupin 2 domain-containing protein